MRNGGDLFPTLHVAVPAAAWAPPGSRPKGGPPHINASTCSRGAPTAVLGLLYRAEEDLP
jgi:hypothetical protein